ncbi:hypothetical protein TeGR_g11165 [Tetraparma gracilis]|uniref:Uncharacterized protein n=1 Tax=Tetraparma gracilis TaxID=2962635 RepID=A0ABQ6MBU7_9STRA|nr:hypothetical protein TeGR_g11165 [Tetraparma gracilis]
MSVSSYKSEALRAPVLDPLSPLSPLSPLLASSPSAPSAPSAPSVLSCSAFFFSAAPSPLSAVRDYQSVSSTFYPKALLGACLRGLVVSLNPKIMPMVTGYQTHLQNLSAARASGAISDADYDRLVGEYEVDYTAFSKYKAAPLLLLKEVGSATVKVLCQSTVLRALELLALTLLPPAASSLSPRLVKNAVESSRRKGARGVGGARMALEMVPVLALGSAFGYVAQIVTDIAWQVGEDVAKYYRGDGRRSRREVATVIALKALIAAAEAAKAKFLMYAAAVAAGAVGAMVKPGFGVTLGILAGELAAGGGFELD